MNLQLEDKFALVTGSTGGIGFAIAKAFAAEGARVIVNGRTEARVAEAISSIRADIPSRSSATNGAALRVEGGAQRRILNQNPIMPNPNVAELLLRTLNYMIKAVLGDRGDEVVELAKTNLWR